VLKNQISHPGDFFVYKRKCTKIANMHDKFLKPYDPKATEEEIYKKWEDSGYFNPDNLPERHKEPFSMVVPPVNVTGVLHLGHAYEDSTEDAIIRFQRMRGKKALWIPGTDSAAIATQARVEKNLKKDEGKSRHDIGREELVKRVKEFAKKSEDTILTQIKAMGASLDWSRYAYTLDDKRNLAVNTAFKRMFDAGLIYRGHRIVNWDPKGQTTISDDEIVYEERKDKFYYFKYGPFTIGTARPETKFGDKYVVINPNDERYSDYEHGQKIELEWINGPLTATVIKDEASDIEMGSGVMTITPWHSDVDFELAEKYNLDKEQIIDQYGKLLPIAEEFSGMKITEARDKIVEKLDKKGLLVKIDEDYVHNVSTAERTGATIEPQIMEQWFVAVDKPFEIPHSEIPGIKKGDKVTLKQTMKATVESGLVSMPQENFRKIYLNWIENLHDWCISRQIWFGHRIPVWYKNDEIYCDVEAPKEDGWTQDEDVLDTWFSASLWPFSTLEWPNETDDLATYFPNSFISPGYEIIQLWVSRMILAANFHMGKQPFKTVLIHGMVRDQKGQKFSKSLGNGIDPLEIIEKYGADALRMSMLVGTAVGGDIKFDEQKVKGYKHFANKIWNATRFVLSNIDDTKLQERPSLLPEHEKHLSELRNVANEISKLMEEYKYHLASDRVYHYFWHTFADVIIEESKEALAGDDEEKKRSAQWMLYEILATSLKLLHPFMPFVTEEIWQHFPDGALKNEKLLMIEHWPDASE